MYAMSYVHRAYSLLQSILKSTTANALSRDALRSHRTFHDTHGQKHEAHIYTHFTWHKFIYCSARGILQIMWKFTNIIWKLRTAGGWWCFKRDEEKLFGNIYDVSSKVAGTGLSWGGYICWAYSILRWTQREF